MLFSSLTFLYYFLPPVILLYFVTPAKYRNDILLIASLFFYFWGEGSYLFLLVLSSLTAYAGGLLITHCRNREKGFLRPRRILIVYLVFNLFLLGFFKYADFFIGNVNRVTKASLPLLHLALPLGISFYTFQSISYVIDVYKGQKPQKNFFYLLTYVSMFPQLVAGPIITYGTVEKHLLHREYSSHMIRYGIERFIMGLAKKVILANQLGELVVLCQDTAAPCTLYYWIQAIAFTLQIYFDFSGYSDMAIGLGRLFGFHFPENFNYPYMAGTITEFWRRWHISLGSWFRDYLYIPLGGNRVPLSKWIRNIIIVWFCTGFWHGANWNFILWGLYFALFLILEKLFLKSFMERLPKLFSHCYTLFFIVAGFVLFRNDSYFTLTETLKGMFGRSGLPFITSESLYYLKSYLVILLFSAAASTPLFKKAGEWIRLKNWGETAALPLYLFLLLLSTAYLVDSSFNPFLYFRF